MKQLTCEMCGSIDLIKQDGVFVCQSCGCKYSVEDAKKMMIEGAVEVTGTVKVDGIHDLETLIENANTFVNLGEFKKAEDLFDRVSNTYPKDYRGWYGKMQALTENFNNNLSVLNSNSKKNEFFMTYKNAIVLSPEGESKHIKEQVLSYVKEVFNHIRSEKETIEKSLKIKDAKHDNERKEIADACQKRCEELKRIDESTKRGAYIITAVIVMLLFVHILFANWWLLLTIPLGIMIITGILAGSGDTPISDDHVPTYVKINKLKNVTEQKIRKLNEEHTKKTSNERNQLCTKESEFNIYNSLTNDINSFE